MYIEGECVEVFGFDKCQGFGEMLRWTAEGKVAENIKRTRLTRYKWMGWDGMGWDGIGIWMDGSPGVWRYRAPDGANNKVY